MESPAARAAGLQSTTIDSTMNLFVCALAALLPLSPAAADELHVPGDFATIQAAINAAASGDTILVHPGTWVENLFYLGKDVEVRSTDGPVVTILDGNRAGAVVTFEAGEGRAALLEGFTVRNGSRTGTQQNGGGVAVAGASPTIRGNVIHDCEANEGGGIGVSNGAPLIEDNEVHSNSADSDYGGGLRVEGASAAVVRGNHFHHNTNAGLVVQDADDTVVLDNLIEHNSSTFSAGGAMLRFTSALFQGNHVRSNTADGGAGLFIGGAGAARVLDNRIELNDSGSFWGGGIECFAAGTPTIRGNLIRANNAPEGGGIGMVNSSDALIEDNLIVGNSALRGGGIYFRVPSTAAGPVVRRNTIAANTAMQGAGLWAGGFDGGAVFSHNIVAAGGSQTGIWCDPGSNPDTPQFSYNDVWVPLGTGWGGSCPDQTGIDGNISVLPEFLEPGVGDYRLATSSLCVDAGDPGEQPAGLDLYGSPRLLDGNLDGMLVLDIGAYEASHVYLHVDQDPAGGAGLLISTSGTPGLHGLVVVGHRGDGGLLPPYGGLYVDLQQPYRVLAVGPQPLRTSWGVPDDPGAPLAIQAFVRGLLDRTGNASNPYFVPLD